MNGVRRQVTIIGPGATGFLRATYRLGPDECVVDVPVDSVPPSLRFPNCTFVGVLVGRELAGIETDGDAWLDIQDRIRRVLNDEWDPIGVAGAVDDEYDGYIAELYAAVKGDASVEAIAAHLQSIETDRIGLRASVAEKLRSVAVSLRSLQLPDVESQGESA